MLQEKQIRLIRILQEEFPVCDRPFQKIGEELGMTEEEVIRQTRLLKEEKKLKRISAAVNHVSIGYAVNSLVAWDIPEEKLEEVAARVIGESRVSHCYERARDPKFDYNFYTMIHARSEEDFEQALEDLKKMIGPAGFCSLRTVKELKKTGMKYFREETL